MPVTAWMRLSAILTVTGAEVRGRICVDNSKAAFFQCPPPLPKEVQTETRRVLWGRKWNTTVALPCPWGMKEQREGKVQKQLGGQQLITAK